MPPAPKHSAGARALYQHSAGAAVSAFADARALRRAQAQEEVEGVAGGPAGDSPRPDLLQRQPQPHSCLVHAAGVRRRGGLGAVEGVSMGTAYTGTRWRSGFVMRCRWSSPLRVSASKAGPDMTPTMWRNTFACPRPRPWFCVSGSLHFV
ncbi:hypothetical protein ACP4OV_023516 [Aristida adscensionis]